VIFKVLVLQHLYNVSDDQIEYQIRDRYTFCRFLGFTPSDSVPDAKTIWLFREQLVKHDMIKRLFYKFNSQLNDHGYKAQRGQIEVTSAEVHDSNVFEEILTRKHL